MSIRCLLGVWRVYAWCLEGSYKVSVGRCLEESGQVKLGKGKLGQVKLGQVKSGNVKSGQRRSSQDRSRTQYALENGLLN